MWDYWPFFTLVLLGGIIGLAFALPSSELAMVTAFILGGAVGSSSDVPVFLSAIMIGAIVRHGLIALGLSVLFGFLIQFASQAGFASDRLFFAIASRSVAIIGMAAVLGAIVFLTRAVTAKRAASASSDAAVIG